MVFIDNNSTDSSVTLISSLMKHDKRIRLFKEPKQGAAAARNKGIANAKGEFIHFFDVDDQLFEGALLALKEVLRINAEIASVFGKIVRASTQKIELTVSKAHSNKINIYKKPFLGLDWFINKNKLPNPPCFLHRRTVFNKINGFQEDLLIGEDAFFHVRLGNECNIASLDRNILHYYRHSDSTVSKQNKKVADKVFTYWPQTIKAYLPYCYSNKVSNGFKFEVYRQVFGSIGKMIVLTKGLKNRIIIKKNCEKEIKPLKIPFVLNLFIYLLVLSGNFNIYKFYFFYLLEPYIKLINKKQDK